MKDGTATLILHESIVYTSSVIVYCCMWNSHIPRCSTKFEDICQAIGNEREIHPSLPYLHQDNLLQLLHIYRLPSLRSTQSWDLTMQPTHYIPTLLCKSKTCFWWKTEDTQDSRGYKINAIAREIQ